MGFAPDNRPTNLPKKCLTPEEAAAAITALRRVLDRLGGRNDADRLQACIGFAQDALWAAAFPDDPYTMLDLIASQAETTMG